MHISPVVALLAALERSDSSHAGLSDGIDRGCVQVRPAFA